MTESLQLDLFFVTVYTFGATWLFYASIGVLRFPSVLHIPTSTRSSTSPRVFEGGCILRCVERRAESGPRPADEDRRARVNLMLSMPTPEAFIATIWRQLPSTPAIYLSPPCLFPLCYSSHPKAAVTLSRAFYSRAPAIFYFLFCLAYCIQQTGLQAFHLFAINSFFSSKRSIAMLSYCPQTLSCPNSNSM